MNKYRVVGCYTQWFYVDVEADDEDMAEDMALSGDEDMTLTDCDDWYIEEVIKK